MRAKQNRSGKVRELSIDSGLDLNEVDLTKGSSHYEKWHWGIAPRRVVNWDDPDYPRTLIECGRLARIHIRLPKSDKHPRLDRDSMIQLSQRAAEHSHVAYDPDHPDQRLYLLLDHRTAPALKRQLWDANDVRAMRLADAARLAGGRHGKRNDYPNVMVKPIGVATALVYVTLKEGDPAGPYLHKMGEVTEYYPFVCIDSKGRLWLAGGGYKSPFEGISD